MLARRRVVLGSTFLGMVTDKLGMRMPRDPGGQRRPVLFTTAAMLLSVNFTCQHPSVMREIAGMKVARTHQRACRLQTSCERCSRAGPAGF